MAFFNSNSMGKELKDLRKKLSHLEVCNVPLAKASNIIGEGSSAAVFKYKLKRKTAACKKFKGYVSEKTMLKAVDSLIKIKDANVVQFLGYRARPSALIMEYCCVILTGKNFIFT